MISYVNYIVIDQNNDDAVIEDIDGLPIEHPSRIVIDITTRSAIGPNETWCGSDWSELNAQ